MALVAKIRTVPKIKATVRPDGTGRLVGVAPITLKNQIGAAGAQNLADLKDVETVELVTGSTLVYNETSGKYEVRPLSDVDLPNVDLGTF